MPQNIPLADLASTVTAYPKTDEAHECPLYGRERPPHASNRSGKDVKSTSLTLLWHPNPFTRPGEPEGISLTVNVLLTKIKNLWYVDLEYPPEYSAAMARIDRGAFRRIVYTTLCEQVRYLGIESPDELRGLSVHGLRSTQKAWKQRGL